MRYTLPRPIDISVQMDCYPCFLRQTALALACVEVSPNLKHEVMKAVLEDIAALDPKASPAHASTPLHRRIRRMLGRDPFAELKHRYNDIALGMLPGLRKTVRASPDPLRTAALLAIAGNIIDFGIYSTVDIGATVERALTEPLAVDDYEGFRASLESAEAAREVLYLLDNTGEVVFDMLLIEELKARGKQVTAVARGGPIINDCTMEDAWQVGLHELCKVTDNGNDAVGTIMELLSPELRQRMEAPGTLVISKGQGNFETLHSWPGNIYFLFQSKCEVVSRLLGMPRGSMLLAEGGADK